MNPPDPPKPPPPPASSYRRPDWEPPLFLDAETNGRRELLLAFALAIAAPVAAVFVSYGLFMGIGGVYCAVTAIQRGRRLGVLALILNVVAIVVALAVRFGFFFWWA